MDLPHNLVDLPALRNRTRVFRDRTHAGKELAALLTSHPSDAEVVLGIPAGGVAVAVPVARELRLPLDLAVVSKITLPWNTESGYGAVAFDGTTRLNQGLLPLLGLGPEDIRRGTERTREKVRRRVRELRGSRPIQTLDGRCVIVVDDGLASGFTMLVAVEALKNAGTEGIIVATPTAHLDAATRLAQEADQVFCANLRARRRFAVADAYERWYDVSEDEVRRVLAAFDAGKGGT